MPAFQDIYDATTGTQMPEKVHFPLTKKEHILRCSYDYWFPKYRSSCIRSEIIPIPQDVIDYLLEDGIVLADKSSEPEEVVEWATPSANNPSTPQGDAQGDSDSDDEEPMMNMTPPNIRFPAFHQQLKDVIATLGGAVAPKLNWSSPQDAAFMMMGNTMKCTSPDDIYMLLKSSTFVGHDLSHAFDECADTPLPATDIQLPKTENKTTMPFAPVLVLRKWFEISTSLEFRCFVKNKSLISLCQRDSNHYRWLSDRRPAFVSKIDDFFEDTLRDTFPDDNYVFDVYVPEDSAAYDSLGRVRLIDINPWAPRTEPLLFDWAELFSIHPEIIHGEGLDPASATDGDESTFTEEEADEFLPELRIVEDGRHANSFRTPFSFHRLPQEVVEAGGDPGGMSEFMGTWQRMLDTQCRMDDRR